MDGMRSMINNTKDFNIVLAIKRLGMSGWDVGSMIDLPIRLDEHRSSVYSLHQVLSTVCRLPPAQAKNALRSYLS